MAILVVGATDSVLGIRWVGTRAFCGLVRAVVVSVVRAGWAKRARKNRATWLVRNDYSVEISCVFNRRYCK